MKTTKQMMNQGNVTHFQEKRKIYTGKPQDDSNVEIIRKNSNCNNERQDCKNSAVGE